MPTPYLTFDGHAQAAFEFYAKVFGGTIHYSQTFGESPMAAEIPSEYHGRIMHITMDLPDGPLMASDCGPWAPFEGPMRGCSLSVQTKTVEEGKATFDALAQGGVVKMPFEATFWSPGYGILTDMFGVEWMVNVEH